MTSINQRSIGAHVSAAGGVDKAIGRAAEIGCNCVQVFSGSPRVWAKPDFAKLAVAKIKSEELKKNVKPIFTHALYLINLGSEKSELLEKSKASLQYELEFDARLDGGGVIVHLGSHLGRGFSSVADQLVASLDELLHHTPENSRLLMENSASRNGKIGGDLSEIQYLLEKLELKAKWVSKKRVGWCFDTCHGFAAGYYLGAYPPDDINTSLDADKANNTEQLPLLKKASGGMQPLSAWDEINSRGLLVSLGCIHVNDSKDPFGSGRDRHANLGEGSIASADLAFFLQRQALRHIPLITEVPGLDGNGPDAENIRRLKRLSGTIDS